MKATVIDVKGESNVLFPRLRFLVEFENDSGEEVGFFNMIGRVYLEKGEVGELLSLDNPFIKLKPKEKRKTNLYLNLDTRRLEIIEEERKGGDLWFTIPISYLGVTRGSQPLIEAIHSYDVRAWSPKETDKCKIFQSQWLGILEELKYSKYKVFEIKMPELPVGTPLDAGVQHLVKAQDMFNAGKYKEVVSNCRMAMEEFRKIINEKAEDISRKIDEGCNPPPKEKKKSEKFIELKRSVHNFSHMGPHTGYPIERRDAETALVSTLLIGKYLAEVLSEGKTTQ
ncbi:MAG: hypothetical protein QMC80_03875 [Thermoplasmatales archaeon]|nr:hypothetical protein [Thermoplasmatales archaeon]